MTLADLDITLANLRVASERIAANLLELELDPGHELLEAAALEGTSAERWSQASATLLELWRCEGLLGELLGRATSVRGTRGRLPADRLAELDELLHGASIVVSSGPVAPEQRALLATTPGAIRCTPRELLARMAQAFDEANATIAELTRAWDDLVARLAAIESLLGEAGDRAAALGDGEVSALEPARRRHAELTALAARDPLGVDAEEVAGFEASLATASRDLSAAAELREQLDARLARAREVVGAIERAREEALSARDEARAKIVAPAVAEPPDDAELEPALARVGTLAIEGRWREAGSELARWGARADALLERVRAATIANRAPVETRNELRGRLEAYRVKAASLRLLEEPMVAELHDRAYGILFAAPTDLRLAAELVVRYQQALSGRPAPSEVMR
jgi:hypothetical protein